MYSPEHNESIPDWFASDTVFNTLYPASIQRLASRHWTPLTIAKEAAHFLYTHPSVNILDIGSGVGKFCLAAAYYFPLAKFIGVEQRATLVNLAEKARQLTAIQNVHFIESNFTAINFLQYDHFYFYNSFYENLMEDDSIDTSVEFSTDYFNTYHRILYKQLIKMPVGTRIATFHSMEMEIPSSYHVVGEGSDSNLKFWMKV